MKPADPPGPNDAIRSPEEQLLVLLRRVDQRHSALWRDVGPAITRTHYLVLRTVERCPQIGQDQLGALVAIDKASLTALINRLEQAGHLVRHVHPEHRSRRQLTLTDTGRAALVEAAPLARGVELQFREKLDERGLAVLLSGMEGIA
ncbi:MAG: MarR family winged helix-turn-helix transcriptional regulator [Segniliparus sp.]|uniref:MarR family winged helix-turn-helix transcriptional regulator n=1 Tax=Segniliparus sp. TaxID=2804064 RepID=UPI003F2F532A